MSTTWLCISASTEEAATLERAGPRRDFVALAARLNANLSYRHGGQGRGWKGKLLGPHVAQAWHTAGRVRRGDRVFADGEHIGLPLLLALALRRRRPLAVVMIGHIPARWWKRGMFALATRLGVPGTLLVHSRRQAQLVRGWLAPHWQIELIPYQVDANYWIDSGDPEQPEHPSILAVGSELRDYDTLIEAARGLPASVLIVAGSHWARELATAQASELPTNVTFLRETLPFANLRDRYRAALIVAVPLHRAENQAGVTTLLEAMSIGRPLIVTATPGQTEVVRGPLITAQGIDVQATADRGPPHEPGGLSAPGAWTGLYVPLADPEGLRAALMLLLRDAALRSRLSRAAEQSARASFSFEAYVDALARAVSGTTRAPAESSLTGVS